ncbi:MAG: hypothetical protein ACREF5_01555 [Candidatus Saccharimonadales bacterium]
MVSFFTFFAAASGSCADNTFLGLEPWYHYLQVKANAATGACEVTSFHLLGSNSSLLLILLAVVDDLFRIAGLLAVFFVIYAGIRYITSQGSPDETSKALSTLINALVGLAIAVVAIGLVSYLGSQIGTGSGAQGTVVSGGRLDLSSLPNPAGAAGGSIIQLILQILFAIIGALSFLFIVIGGMRFVFSSGDPKNAAQAQGTVIYALVGLIVAIVAESIVSLVIGKL